MFRRIRHTFFILLMCLILGMTSSALAYEPTISSSTIMFYACMADYDYAYSQTDQSYGNNYCTVFKDRATYAGYGWDSAYTLVMEGQGNEEEGRMTSITYDAALERTFAPGKTDRVLSNVYEFFLAAAGGQFSDSDCDLFCSRYSSSRMWQVLQRYSYGDLDTSSLSSRIGGWNIYVDVAYGDNEMHFYFYMNR